MSLHLAVQAASSTGGAAVRVPPRIRTIVAGCFADKPTIGKRKRAVLAVSPSWAHSQVRRELQSPNSKEKVQIPKSKVQERFSRQPPWRALHSHARSKCHQHLQFLQDYIRNVAASYGSRRRAGRPSPQLRTEGRLTDSCTSVGGCG